MTRLHGPVLLLGATSDIGRALAHAYGKACLPLILVARDASRLDRDVQDLHLRYDVPVRAIECDVLQVDDPGRFYDSLGELPGTVVSLVGLLGDQTQARLDAAEGRRIMATNFVAPAALLGEAANRMERRGYGTVIGVSSVAGDRGRASNYVYGSAKAGLTAYLSGLRHRLARSGVRVLTVKPGFVATRMTAGMKLPAVLTAQPDEVARAVIRAQEQGRDVVYVRPIWRLIMTVIRVLPESLFKKLSI